WVEHGEKYPLARHALLSVRDDATQVIENGEGSFTLFREVAAINENLRDQAQPVQLFKLMDRDRPKLARQCYGVPERVLVDSGEFAICIRYLPDLEQKLEAIGQTYQMTLEIAKANPVLIRIT